MRLAEDRRSHLSLVEEEERVPFATFVCDDETLAVARALAGKRGWSRNDVQRGGLDAALRQLGIVTAPEVMLVDLSEADEEAQALAGLRELAGSSRVIAVGTRNDVEMFRKVLDAGALDYLVKPVDAALLDQAVERAESGGQAAGPAPRRKGRCIAFIGVRGGVGTTALAANTAWLIAEERRRRVTLIDLDLQFGTLALALDLQASAGLREALEDPERVDEIFLDRAGVPLGERMVVMAAEEPVEDSPRLVGDGVAKVVGEIRQRQDLLVLDLPRGLLGQAPGLLEELTDIVLVSDLSLAGLRDCNRLLRFLKAQDCKARTRIVADRVDKGDKGQLVAAEFARELEGSLDLKLSEDAAAMSRAAIAGKPLAVVEPRSRLLKDMRALTTELVGESRHRRGGLLHRLTAMVGRK